MIWACFNIDPSGLIKPTFFPFLRACSNFARGRLSVLCQIPVGPDKNLSSESHCQSLVVRVSSSESRQSLIRVSSESRCQSLFVRVLSESRQSLVRVSSSESSHQSLIVRVLSSEEQACKKWKKKHFFQSRRINIETIANHYLVNLWKILQWSNFSNHMHKKCSFQPDQQ